MTRSGRWLPFVLIGPLAAASCGDEAESPGGNGGRDATFDEPGVTDARDATSAPDAAADAGFEEVGPDAGLDASPPTVPSAPNGLQAMVTTSSTVLLTWIDQSDDETGFTIERSCLEGDVTFVEIGTAPTDTPRFEDLSPPPGVSCRYRARAFNAVGASPPSNEVEVDIPPHRFALSVRKSASGNGLVLQVEPDEEVRIRCGDVCRLNFDAGTIVRLVAMPAGPDTFPGPWEGCDELAGGACVVTMDASKEVLATFLSSITISTPAAGHVDHNGEYVLQWGCWTGRCPNDTFVIEEDSDDRFESPTRYPTISDRIPDHGAYRFRKTSDGTFCYRVSYLNYANWSAPRCVTVTRAPLILPRTGQWRNFGTGDDGRERRGLSWPIPRFTDHQDGTITDELTGLMWLEFANCIGHYYEDFSSSQYAVNGWVGWSEAKSFVEGMNGGLYPDCANGYADWRIPNVNEMLSLYPFGQTDARAWLRDQGFLAVGLESYWTSTIPTYAFRSALVLSLDSFTAALSRSSTEPVYQTVWPVRTADPTNRQVARTNQSTCRGDDGAAIGCRGTGQDGETQTGVPWPAFRFVDQGDGTVRDELTHLIWLEDADCMNSWYPGLSDDDGHVAWQDAIDFVDRLNQGRYPFCDAGQSDWRLPNVNELRSLIDFETPFADYAHTVGLANVADDTYWSSTTHEHEGTDVALAAHFGASLVRGYPKTTVRGYVWPVRGGD